MSALLALHAISKNTEPLSLDSIDLSLSLAISRVISSYEYALGLDTLKKNLNPITDLRFHHHRKSTK